MRSVRLIMKDGDTLGMVRTQFLSTKDAGRMGKKIGRPLEVRFMLKTSPPREIPDNMRVSEFERLEGQGLAFIEINDGGMFDTTAHVTKVPDKKSK